MERWEKGGRWQLAVAGGRLAGWQAHRQAHTHTQARRGAARRGSGGRTKDDARNGQTPAAQQRSSRTLGRKAVSTNLHAQTGRARPSKLLSDQATKTTKDQGVGAGLSCSRARQGRAGQRSAAAQHSGRGAERAQTCKRAECACSTSNTATGTSTSTSIRINRAGSCTSTLIRSDATATTITMIMIMIISNKQQTEPLTRIRTTMPSLALSCNLH